MAIFISEHKKTRIFWEFFEKEHSYSFFSCPSCPFVENFFITLNTAAIGQRFVQVFLQLPGTYFERL